MLKAYIT